MKIVLQVPLIHCALGSGKSEEIGNGRKAATYTESVRRGAAKRRQHAVSSHWLACLKLARAAHFAAVRRRHRRTLPLSVSVVDVRRGLCCLESVSAVSDSRLLSCTALQCPPLPSSYRNRCQQRSLYFSVVVLPTVTDWPSTAWTSIFS